MHAQHVLAPHIQKLHQYDWSNGHKKGKEYGLAIASMNLNYGGKGGKSLQNTELTEDSVGNDEKQALMYAIIVEGGPSVWLLTKPEQKEGFVVKEHDFRVRAGNTQSMYFAKAETNPPPPFYALKDPHHNTTDLDEQGKPKMTKKGHPKVILGYTNQAKGINQILWERCLWKEGMRSKLDSEDPTYPELIAKDVLANCQDFREENGATEDLIQSYGNMVLFTLKRHPDIAGAGIEYDWGVSKKVFWRTTNHVAKDHERDARLSLSRVTLQAAKNTARKSRSYMRAYKNDAGGSHLLIKFFVKIHKHRFYRPAYTILISLHCPFQDH